MVEQEGLSGIVALEDGQTVGPFTRRQRQVLEYVDMGCKSQLDIAFAMRCMEANVATKKGQIVRKFPVLEFQWRNRIDAAIEMREEGNIWKEIAENLGYKTASSAFNSVEQRIGPRVKTLHKK